MTEVQIGKIYRHFKGKYLSSFLGEIEQNREDNITHQTHRFELVEF